MENYFDNTSRWIYDLEGNYLHTKGKEINPNIERDGYFFSNSKEDIYIKEEQPR